MEISQEMSQIASQQAYQLPLNRVEYIRAHGITGADHLLAKNPNLIESGRKYRAQIAFFISKYGYIPTAKVNISEPTSGKSGDQLKDYIDFHDDDNIQAALRERNADLEHHVITLGGTYDAMKEVPGLVENADRRLTKRDYINLYSISVLGLQHFLFAEKIRALTERNKSTREKSKIKVYGLEGNFEPLILKLLAALRSLEQDENNKPIPPVAIRGIIPTLEAQLRTGAARDAVIAAKLALAEHTLNIDELENTVAILTEKGINFGLGSSLCADDLYQALMNYPQQAGTFHILKERTRIDREIGKWQQKLNKGPKHRNWEKWLLNHDDSRQNLLKEFMGETFAGNIIEGVKFEQWETAKAQYNPEEQYTYPTDINVLGQDMRPIAFLYAGLSAV